MRVMLKFICITILLFLSGCGDAFRVSPLHMAAPSAEDNSAAGEELPGEEPPGEELVDNTNIPFCSDLSFKGVTFPEDFYEADRDALALALNISGSFEGGSGWVNLSNNFDGQGISMGLLNQNLGQGSLQPLFIELRDRHFAVLQKYMSQAMLNLLLKMLSDWEKNKSLNKLQELNDQTMERIPLSLNATEDIDKFYALPLGEITLQLASYNQKSVDWAVKNIYSDSSGRNFKGDWKNALKNIAGDPAYVSLQVKASRRLYDRAHLYKERLGFTDVRSYLFLFDIVVQNGSLKEKHFANFFTWLQSNPKASEEKQMLELLEIRLLSVIAKWRNDVRARKKTIILGSGSVHGASRNLPKEYCYDQSFPYRQEGGIPAGLHSIR